MRDSNYRVLFWVFWLLIGAWMDPQWDSWRNLQFAMVATMFCDVRELLRKLDKR